MKQPSRPAGMYILASLRYPQPSPVKRNTATWMMAGASLAAAAAYEGIRSVHHHRQATESATMLEDHLSAVEVPFIIEAE